MADFPVVWLGAWQALHPIFPNTCCPRLTVVVDVDVVDVEVVEVPAADDKTLVEVSEAVVGDVDEVEVVDCAVAAAVPVAGVGGANMRIKAVKLTMSDE